MKRIFAAALMAAAVFSASAQIMRLETEQGTKVYDLSRVKSISFSDEQNTEDLVKMEVVNASTLAFDLKVTKSPSCHRYMAAAYSKSIYQESNFIFSAEQTLADNAYYRPFESTLSYSSKTFSETQLGLNSLTDDARNPLTIIAAVYAIDDLGAVKVYTHEFTLPSQIKQESDMQMKIEVSNVTYGHFDYAISPVGWVKPAKALYGVTRPEWMKTTAEKFNAMTDDAKQTFLFSQGLGMPQPYTAKITGSGTCNAQSDIIIFAIPVDDEGKVGKMTITTFQTPEVLADGIGSFASLAYNGETSGEDDYASLAHFTVKVDNAIAYRLLWTVEKEFNDNDYSSSLIETFLNEKMSEYGIWTQFKANQNDITLNIMRHGQNYVLYGVTIDIDGNISQPVNLLEKFTGSGTITTKSNEEE